MFCWAPSSMRTRNATLNPGWRVCVRVHECGVELLALGEHLRKHGPCWRAVCASLRRLPRCRHLYLSLCA